MRSKALSTLSLLVTLLAWLPGSYGGSRLVAGAGRIRYNVGTIKPHYPAVGDWGGTPVERPGGATERTSR